MDEIRSIDLTRNLDMEQDMFSRALQFVLQVYWEIYMVDLEGDCFSRIYPQDPGEEFTGSYRNLINERVLNGVISSENEEDISKLLQPEGIREALMNEDSVEYQYSRMHKGAPNLEEDEMERCSTLVAVTRRENGVPASVVMGVRSIENIVQREERQNAILKGALLRAEQANEAKTTFLANMSHDIRTPLNAIMGFTDLAMGHLEDSAKLADCLGKIKSSSKLLLELIDDILDMSRIESGRMDIERAECNIERVMTNIWHNLEKQILEKKLHYEADLRNLRNPDVLCDELRLTQILFNVIGNAVKYNKPEGDIFVRIAQTASLGPGFACYEFRVRDTGIGISPEFIAKMFAPFEREKTSTVSRISGTGLGLAITKNLVELMTGTIDVHSKVGEGSEFIIKLPFQISKTRHEKPAAESDAGKEKDPFEALKGRRILLVEDNELNREIARALFEEKGLVVGEAEDGDVVVRMLQEAETPYDCIIMDIQMPRMNGLETTKAVRGMDDPVLSKIPIIGMSANAFEEDRKKSLETGMNAHIAKPIDMDVVLATLIQFL